METKIQRWGNSLAAPGRLLRDKERNHTGAATNVA